MYCTILLNRFEGVVATDRPVELNRWALVRPQVYIFNIYKILYLRQVAAIPKAIM